VFGFVLECPIDILKLLNVVATAPAPLCLNHSLVIGTEAVIGVVKFPSSEFV
jgi:hypothetical protein